MRCSFIYVAKIIIIFSRRCPLKKICILGFPQNAYEDSGQTAWMSMLMPVVAGHTCSRVESAVPLLVLSPMVPKLVDRVVTLQWTLVTTTAFVPKDVAIKMNLLL